MTTIEHNQEWSKLLKEHIRHQKIHNIDFHFIGGEKDLSSGSKNFCNPDDFVSSDKHSIGLSFEKYVKSIDNFPHEYFDIIVVDGRARNSCIKRAIPHLKKGGVLV